MERGGRARFGDSELTKKYAVRAFPTVQLLDKKGKDLKQMVGVSASPGGEIDRIQRVTGK